MGHQQHQIVFLCLVGGPLLWACDHDNGEDRTFSSSPWNEWEVVSQIGEEARPAVEVFGEIRDAAIAHVSRDILILDGTTNEIRIFTSGGVPLTAFGRSGDGPGEFRYPVALITLLGDTILVPDLERRVIHAFEWHGMTARLLGSYKLPFAPIDGCRAHGRVYLLGRWRNMAIHTMTRSGEILRSFGPLESTGKDSLLPDLAGLLKHERSQGHLLCIPEHDIIVHATEDLGEIRAYDSSGSLVWSHAIDNFAQPLRTLRGAGVRYDLNPDLKRADRIVSLIFIPPNLIEVVIKEQYSRDAPRSSRNIGLALSSFSGVELGRFDTPEFIDLFKGIALSKDTDPFPLITAWRVAENSGSFSEWN